MKWILNPAGRMIALGIVAFVAVSGGCDKAKKKAGSDFKKAAKAYVGIHQITKMTKNEKSCKAEGTPIPAKEMEKYFVAFETQTFVGPGVSVTSCNDPADCKKKTSGKEAASFIYLFTEAKGKGIAGIETFTGFSRDGQCQDARHATLTLEKEGQEVVLRVRAVKLSYPAPKDRMCSTKSTRKLAKGKPCNEYTVIRAKRVGDV